MTKESLQLTEQFSFKHKIKKTITCLLAETLPNSNQNLQRILL